MAVSNAIVKKEKTQSQVTEYESNGEIVKISPALIRKYLVNGGGNVTDEEVMAFLSLCRFQHLNPFLREAYLIKYGDKSPATMVVGKDVFLKRARRQPDFTGLQGGIIAYDLESGELRHREGTYYDKEAEKLVGGWAKVYVKGYTVPFFVSVSLDEYIGRKSNGEVNAQWSGKPATMIRKVAIAQALKEAFPDVTAGLYGQEEIERAQGVDLDESLVVAEDTTAEAVEPEKEAEPDVAGALFGEV